MTHSWQPTASLDMLKKRAAVLAQIREFFAAREVLEVDTPLVCHATVTAPYILSIPALVRDPRTTIEKTCYLQTSPEYAMKRLLAAGSGSIYQICKAFRQDEVGNIHNPEFTMLEWYRAGFDHHALMDEVDDLFQTLMETKTAERLSYAEAFKRALGFDPHEADAAYLENHARKHVGIQMQGELERDGWLHLLMSHCIEPSFSKDCPTFIYDFPASQAALARVREGNPSLASRVEVYYGEIELGNGFHELQAAAEQRRRFEQDLLYRAEQGIPLVPVDEELLAALAHGLPDSAGIAIGIDRLVMVVLGCKTIKEVMSFDFERA